MENPNNPRPFEVNNGFYERYNSQIKSVVARILYNADQQNEIEDCVNTVYLELMENLQKYNDTKGSLSAFVTIVARTTALDYCKKNRRKPKELVGDEKLDVLSDPVGFEDKAEFEMLVEDILKQLNKDERILYTMRYLLFYTPEEIAKSLKIRRSAVDMRVSRLKSKVKHLLVKGGAII